MKLPLTVELGDSLANDSEDAIWLCNESGTIADADKLWFGDYHAIGYREQVKLQYPYRALVNKVHKAALIFDIRPGAQSRLDRGICGEVSIDRTGAWSAEYAAAKDNPHDKERYLPINEVLLLLGYGAAQ